MSVVTGIMLMLGASEWGEPPINEVQQWLTEKGWPPLRDVSRVSGGGKHPQFEAWSAGYNYFDEEAFTEFVLSRQWRDPTDVVLIINPEEGPMSVLGPCDSGSHPEGENAEGG